MKVVEIPFIACLLLVILQINIAFARLRAADESSYDYSNSYNFDFGSSYDFSYSYNFPSSYDYSNSYNFDFGSSYDYSYSKCSIATNGCSGAYVKAMDSCKCISLEEFTIIVFFFFFYVCLMDRCYCY